MHTDILRKYICNFKKIQKPKFILWISWRVPSIITVFFSFLTEEKIEHSWWSFLYFWETFLCFLFADYKQVSDFLVYLLSIWIPASDSQNQLFEDCFNFRNITLTYRFSLWIHTSKMLLVLLFQVIWLIYRYPVSSVVN